ncbi:MAG: acyl carrier protein [Deltaproteobacteria bacterium]|nr:acyl carrier protein [Deltaproteobacteria bacterium]
MDQNKKDVEMIVIFHKKGIAMHINEFMDELKETLEFEDDLFLATNLKQVEGYDSLAVLGIIALIDEKFGKTLTAPQLASITTIQSLVELIGKEHF